MRSTIPFLRNSLFLLLAFLALTASRASGQMKPAAARIVRAVDDTQTVTLKGNVHPLARAEFDRGTVEAGQAAGRMLLLLQRSPEQETALHQLIDEQQTKSSSNFHAWLTPEQFGQQFGPADADIQAVTTWLAAQGFSGIKLGAGRTTIEFSGTVGQVQEAFHTELHNYLVNGNRRIANSSDPQIPVALSPVVAGVVSLNSFPKLSHARRIGTYERDEKTGEVRPLLTTTSGCGAAGTSPCYAVGPGDFAKIYNIPSTLDGTGQTIAIVGQTNINVSDVQAFRAFFGLTNNFSASNIILNGPDPGITSVDEEGEADLDVQWSGAVAPKATIKLVVSETTDTGITSGIDLSALYIIDNNVAPVMSESYGACEAGLGTIGNAFYNALWQQAAAEGITVLLSTGDNGSAGCDDFTTASTAANGIAVSGFASTPYNIAVGGTDFNDVGSFLTYWTTTNAVGTKISALSYIPEVPWNESCAAGTGIAGCNTATAGSASLNIVAASGGQSTIYPKPSWQTGTGVPAASHRYLPDISLFASSGKNQSFYITCQADSVSTPSQSCARTGPAQFIGVGGTSASSPAFAGIIALINQSQLAAGKSGRQGNANYTLYKLAAASGASCTSNTATAATPGSCVFYDVASGNISVPCAGGATTPNCSKTSAGGFGVLVDPASTSTAAWAATAGYDRATGLGTVNVANLATAWPTATFTTSAVVLATTTTTITHGANANFTVNVTGTGGTPPSGLVSLSATPAGGTVQEIGPFTLTAGSVAISTNKIPGGGGASGGGAAGGPVSVVAHYAGDGTFGANDSTPVSVTVNRESSKAFVNLLAINGNTLSTVTSAVYGSPYIMRVDVTNGSSTQCSANSDNGTIPPITTIPCPTGNVTLTDNGTPLNDFTNLNTPGASNVVTLNSLGYFEDQPIQLSGGTHAIVATYAGDSSYSGSASATDTITISKAGTTTGVGAAPATATTSQTVTLTATVVAPTSNGAGPTGTVTFSANGSAISGTPTYVSTPLSSTAFPTLTATLTTTFSTTGTKSITASYVGDTNYTASATTSAATVTVSGTGGGGTFSIAGTATTVTAGGTGTSTISVTPTNGTAPGTVNITCASSGLPPGVTCTPNPLAIAATSSTNATTGPLTISVTAPSSAMTASLTNGHPVMVAAAPVGSGSVRNGWWTLSAGTGLAALFLFFVPGQKKFRAGMGLSLVCLASLALGCGGGGGGSGGGGGGTTPAATTTTLTVSSTKVASTGSLTVGVNVHSSSGTPAGTVQFYDGATPLGVAVPLVSGAFSRTLTSANAPVNVVGTHAVSVRYIGTTGFSASASGALNVTVTGTTSVAISATPTASSATPIALTIN